MSNLSEEEMAELADLIKKSFGEQLDLIQFKFASDSHSYRFDLVKTYEQTFQVIQSFYVESLRDLLNHFRILDVSADRNHLN